MISFILGGLLIGCLFYMAFIFESTSLALLGMSLTVLLVFSFLYLFQDTKRLHINLEMPVTIAEKDKIFHARIQVRHGKPLGYQKLLVYVEYKNSLELKGKLAKLTMKRVSGEDSEYEFELRIKAAGNYDFTLKKVRIYDLFGLFFLEQKLEGGTQAMVLPEIREVPVVLGEGVRHFFGDADVYDELRPGYDPSESFGVREFQDGDKMPNIHWKLSAKLDTLMVRENSMPKACPVVLFFDTGEEKPEEMLELIAGVSFNLMEQGCPHYAVWKSRSTKDLVRTRVDDEESFYQFLVAYLQDREAGASPDLLERYYEKYRQEKGLYELVFRQGQFSVNGDVIDTSGEFEVLLQ